MKKDFGELEDPVGPAEDFAGYLFEWDDVHSVGLEVGDLVDVPEDCEYIGQTEG